MMFGLDRDSSIRRWKRGPWKCSFAFAVGEGTSILAGQDWLKGDGMFVCIVNGPDRLRWGYHEQSYRVKPNSAEEKTWLFHCRSYGSRNRLKNIVFENDAHRKQKVMKMRRLRLGPKT